MRAAIGPARNATKATGPAAAVAKAMRPTAATMLMIRVRSTRTPRAAAVSSPSWRRRRWPDWLSRIGVSTTTAIASGANVAQSASLTLPVIHRIAAGRSHSAALVST